MGPNIASQPPNKAAQKSPRLHYLDWLRVLAIFIVFLFHAVHPFDFNEWHIKNIQQSETLTIILTILSLWGMPFFFFVAGTASWFALQRRTASRYANERFKRLFIPYIVGSILFLPLSTYLEWCNKLQRGVYAGTFKQFVNVVINYLLSLGFSPCWLSIGQHLWFLGFLFSFAILTLPLYLWFKKAPGQRLIEWMAQRSEYRGGILLFILPLLVVKLSLQPFFPAEHDWSDFIFQMSFFILGFLLYADKRFTLAIHRDWWLLLILAIVILLSLLGMYLAGIPIEDWSGTPTEFGFYFCWSLITVFAFCTSITTLFVGMRFLDFTNQWLNYAQKAVLPFFIVHQPIIIVIAFFVVQWKLSIPLKILIVVPSSFLVAMALYELIIRRIPILRILFGMSI